MKKNVRVFERIENIIRIQFEPGDEFTAQVIHSRLFDRYGTNYLPQRVTVSVLLKRSDLVSVVSPDWKVATFKKL